VFGIVLHNIASELSAGGFFFSVLAVANILISVAGVGFGHVFGPANAAKGRKGGEKLAFDLQLWRLWCCQECSNS
jgi:hypothetical protein